MRTLVLSLFSIITFATSALHAQENTAKSGTDLPGTATEIVIEDLTVTIKRARITVVLTPQQIENLTRILQGAGANVETAGENGGEGE